MPPRRVGDIASVFVGATGMAFVPESIPVLAPLTAAFWTTVLLASASARSFGTSTTFGGVVAGVAVVHVTALFVAA